ncbi:MAG TPA: cytochrome P450 [Polyangiaceae bacterium]|nr:cytochrome P450 [Polyangiaceae bacterium]
MNAELPTVAGANLLGHAHLFRKDRLALLRAVAEAGPITRLRFFHKPVLFVSSPEMAHQVLVERARSFEKSPALKILFHDLAGEGLFTSEGPLWQRQRRLMSPLFHAEALTSYAQTMHAVAARAVAPLQEGASVDLAPEMTRIAMNVVAATLFGAETDADAEELGRALRVAFAWVDEQLASARLSLQISAFEAFEHVGPHMPQAMAAIRDRIGEALSGPVLLPGHRDAELQTAFRTIDSKIQALIDDRRANPTSRVDLLTKLVLARDAADADGMSDRQARDEAVTLFVAGHETTANALAWTFYLLARNPEARARVQAEADACSPDDATPPALDRLAYTTRVFKESLRLYPPVLVLPRRSLEPFELGGRLFPARMLVFVNAFGLHRSASVWPDPDRFDPDRFLPESEAKRPKSAWLPFGVGPRVCIGNHFALMEGPIVLATWMRRARFEIDATRTIEPDSFPALRPTAVPAVVRKIRP